MSAVFRNLRSFGGHLKAFDQETATIEVEVKPFPREVNLGEAVAIFPRDAQNAHLAVIDALRGTALELHARHGEESFRFCGNASCRKAREALEKAGVRHG